MPTEFEIYTIEPYDTIIQPLLIVTCHQNNINSTAMSGEYFVIIPDKDNTLIWKTITISNRILQSDYSLLFQATDNHITIEEISAAEIELKKYYINKHGDSILLTDLCKPKFIKSEQSIIVRYAMRKVCDIQIRKIIDMTNCESLLQFLISVRHYPRIAFSNESGNTSPYS